LGPLMHGVNGLGAGTTAKKQNSAKDVKRKKGFRVKVIKAKKEPEEHGMSRKSSRVALIVSAAPERKLMNVKRRKKENQASGSSKRAGREADRIVFFTSCTDGVRCCRGLDDTFVWCGRGGQRVPLKQAFRGGVRMRSGFMHGSRGL